jgi:hypothetical protein
VPRPNLFKIGVAIAAAAVGAILAISTVFAHSTPTSTGHSVAGSIVKAAHAASFPVFANDPVPNAFTSAAELKAEAAEAAAELAAEQAALAAKLAALKAAAAADPCLAADAAEDVAEKAADKLEDAAEKANPALETPDEDAKEKAARQTAEKAEPPEVKCAGAAATKVKTFASSAHHLEGKHDH